MEMILRFPKYPELRELQEWFHPFQLLSNKNTVPQEPLMHLDSRWNVRFDANWEDIPGRSSSALAFAI